jgi:RimJ/RimL family protein N-acetyltransferase
MQVPELRTERLLLRDWRAADRPPFAALNADADVVEFLGGARDRAASDALVDAIAAHWVEHGFGLWAVERLEDGQFLGFTGLSRPTFVAHFTPAVEVGWRLARRAWGHGYATEAARASIAFGFETVGLDEIVSFTVPANTRSRAVMKRIGMTREASDDFDHPRLREGDSLRRHVMYRLTRDDWRRAEPR